MTLATTIAIIWIVTISGFGIYKALRMSGARGASITFDEVDQSGELELRLDVNGHEGSVWISREFCQAMLDRWKGK